MKRWQRLAAIVAVPILGVVGIGLPGGVAGASTVGPTITDFVGAPSSLTAAGGVVDFSATLTLASTCTLSSSSKPTIPGLPITSTTCGVGLPTATVPANTSKKPITYKFTLTVQDILDKTKTAKATTSVSEAASLPGTYVALGDSYSAGFGNPGPYLTEAGNVEPSGTTDDGCQRTESAYPVTLAKWLKGSRSPIKASNFSFLACSGATSTDVWSGSPATSTTPPLAGTSLDHGEAPQLNDVGDLANAKVVTLSIGGNDLSFSTVLTSCVIAPADCNASSLLSSAVADLETNITNLKSVLVATYQQVEAEAPNASIYVMGYPDIVPPNPSPSQQTDGCGPFGAGSAVSYLATAENNLNAVIASAASQAGLHYVDPNDSNPKDKNSFLGHSVCDKDD